MDIHTIKYLLMAYADNDDITRFQDLIESLDPEINKLEWDDFRDLQQIILMTADNSRTKDSFDDLLHKYDRKSLDSDNSYTETINSKVARYSRYIKNISKVEAELLSQIVFTKKILFDLIIALFNNNDGRRLKDVINVFDPKKIKFTKKEIKEIDETGTWANDNWFDSEMGDRLADLNKKLINQLPNKYI